MRRSSDEEEPSNEDTDMVSYGVLFLTFSQSLSLSISLSSNLSLSLSFSLTLALNTRLPLLAIGQSKSQEMASIKSTPKNAPFRNSKAG